MKARNGKVARLPPSLQGKVLVAGKERGEIEIRDQLNARLADGEPGNRPVEWLNSNPDVMKVMTEQFDGRPITEGNLSEWRAGGYEEWHILHAFLDETRVVSENAGEIADTGISSDHMRIVLLAQHAHLFQNLGIMPKDEFNHRLNAVKKLTASIMNMQRAELQKARLELQRERFELQRERFEFQREKQRMKSAASSEAVGRGAGGGPGKSRAAASTSARAESSGGRPPAQPRVSPSSPSILPTADPHGASSAESAAPQLAAPAPDASPKVLSSRIHPDAPVTDSPHQPHFPKPDSVGLTSTQPSRLAA